MLRGLHEMDHTVLVLVLQGAQHIVARLLLLPHPDQVRELPPQHARQQGGSMLERNTPAKEMVAAEVQEKVAAAAAAASASAAASQCGEQGAAFPCSLCKYSVCCRSSHQPTRAGSACCSEKSLQGAKPRLTHMEYASGGLVRSELLYPLNRLPRFASTTLRYLEYRRRFFDESALG